MKGSEMVELLILEQVVSTYQDKRFTNLYDKMYDMEKLLIRYNELSKLFMAPYVKNSDSEE
jgi:hypothetical protein